MCGTERTGEGTDLMLEGSLCVWDGEDRGGD